MAPFEPNKTVAAEAVDLDLDDIWPAFVRECEEILHQPLPQRGLDSAAFRASINEVQKDLDGSKSRKKTWALQVAKRVSECLEQFGEIVAQGASVVFGPSEQCWNAISFVIKAAKSYREILEGFVVLLDLCANFLDRMLYYLNQASSDVKLESHMRRPAYEFLGHFLRILAHSYHIAHSKKEKVNQLMHVVFFNDDAGVKHDIGEMKELVNRFNDRAWDQTFMEVKGITRFMLYSAEERKAHESETRESFERLEEITTATYEATWELKQGFEHQESEKEVRQNIKTIRDAFQLGPDDAWYKTHGTYRARRIGTAEWLKQNEDYRNWKQINQTGANLLTLTAKSGYGKSFVCCNAIDDLLSYSRQDGVRRISVAFYYFDHSDKENCALDRCIASVILQLAKSDPAYAKAVVEACDRERLPSSPGEVWKTLVLDLRSSRKSTDFIVLDDYRESDTDGSGGRSLADIINAPVPEHDGYSIRWLVSSADAEFATKCDRRTQIRLGSRQRHFDQDESDSQSMEAELVLNETDLMEYVEDGIARICAKADLGPLLDNLEVKSALVQGADGDYQLLQGKLNEIDSTSTHNEVRHILSRASESSVASIRRIIKTLNANLTQREIDQLNEMLTWMVFAKGPKSIGLLRNVLLWIKDEDYQLRKQVASKFSPLLDVTEINGEAYVDLAYERDQVEKVLRSRSHYEEDAEPSEELNLSLHPSEISVIEHFVKKNCTDDLYARFGFDSFFKEKSAGPDKSLQLVGKSASHAHILSTCLDALIQRQDEPRWQHLRQYAVHWLGEHVKGTVGNLGEVSNDLSRELGSKLATLLWDPVSISSWWDEEWLSVLKTDWIENDKDYYGALIKILMHESIVPGFTSDSEHHKWIRSVLERGALREDLLAQVAKQLMLRTLRSPGPDDLNFACAFSIMSQKFGIEDTSKPTISDLNAFMLWHKSDEITDAYWNCELGIVYWINGFMEEALAKLQQARIDFPENSVFLSVLIELYFHLDKFEQSLECLHTMPEWPTGLTMENPRYEQWQKGLVIGAKCHSELGEYYAAAACYGRFIENSSIGDYNNDTHGEAVSGLLVALAEGQYHEDVIATIMKWGNDTTLGLRYWILQLAAQDDAELLISNAAKKTGRRREVCDMFRNITEDPNNIKVFQVQHDDEETRLVNWLQYSCAVLTFDLSNSVDDHWEAIQRWESLTELSGTSSMAYWPAKFSLKCLGTALLDLTTRTTQNTGTYLKSKGQLEALASSGRAVIRNSHNASGDPRLPFARLCMIQCQAVEAEKILFSRLRRIFDGWTDALDDDELGERFWQLAPTLSVLGCNSDARAAYQAMKPKKHDQDVVDQFQREDAFMQSTGVDAAGADASKADASGISSSIHNAGEDSSPSAQTGSAELRSKSYSVLKCDLCDTKLVFDLFACRNCSDVQYCPDCYPKVKSGEQSKPLCHRDHDFLAVGPINPVAWRQLSPGEILVDGKAIAQKAWLDAIREEWSLRQDQIDAYKAAQLGTLRAAKVIATAISRYLRKKKVRSGKGDNATGP